MKKVKSTVRIESVGIYPISEIEWMSIIRYDGGKKVVEFALAKDTIISKMNHTLKNLLDGDTTPDIIDTLVKEIAMEDEDLYYWAFCINYGNDKRWVGVGRSEDEAIDYMNDMLKLMVKKSK